MSNVEELKKIKKAISNNLCIDYEIVDNMNIEIQLDNLIVFPQELVFLIIDRALANERMSFAWHYTSLKNGLSILLNNEIFLSALPGFNDSNEMKTMRDKYSSFDSKLNMPTNIGNHLNSHFVFSMSKNEDDLTLWRLYGDNGRGMAIGFQAYAKLHERTIVSNVIYDDSINKLAKNILKLKSELDSYEIQMENLHLLAHYEKDSIWKVEEEIRIVINSFSRDKQEWVVNGSQIIVPRLRVKLSELSNIRLYKVVMGPVAANLDVNISQLEYLQKIGKINSEIDIMPSMITTYR